VKNQPPSDFTEVLVDEEDNGSLKQIRSVVRALSILNAIGGGAKGISTIAKELDLSKGTIFDLMKTLESMDYVVQEKESEKYRIGPALRRLAASATANLDMVEVARPHLQALADDTGEVVQMGKREGFAVLYVVRANSRLVTRMLALNSQVGRLSPLHCTSMGKLFLAHLPEVELAQFLRTTELKAYTDRTLITEAALRQELQRIREQGYSLNLGEFEDGVSSVAVPVLAGDGRVVAGVNVATPSVRLPTEKIPLFRKKLQAAANQISLELGF
jgi:DNA-binding IclR family transcriptional regulator